MYVKFSLPIVPAFLLWRLPVPPMATDGRDGRARARV